MRWPENEKFLQACLRPSLAFNSPLFWNNNTLCRYNAKRLLLYITYLLWVPYKLAAISKWEILDFGSLCSTPSIGWDDLKMKSFLRHACGHLWPSLDRQSGGGVQCWGRRILLTTRIVKCVQNTDQPLTINRRAVFISYNQKKKNLIEKLKLHLVSYLA